MNRIISILLLLCFLLPGLSSFSWLHYQRYLIKSKIKWQLLAALPDDDLLLLKFHEKDVQKQLHWEHSREFEYEWKMYDVVRQKKQGDTLYLWCFEDHQETSLKQKIRHLVNTSLANNIPHQSQQQSLLKWLDSLFFDTAPDILSFNKIIWQKKPLDYLYNLYYSIAFPPLSPPPKI